MNPTNHLLVLSQPEFLERQIRGMLDEPASLSAARRIRLWITRSA